MWRYVDRMINDGWYHCELINDQWIDEGWCNGYWFMMLNDWFINQQWHFHRFCQKHVALKCALMIASHVLPVDRYRFPVAEVLFFHLTIFGNQYFGYHWNVGITIWGINMFPLFSQVYLPSVHIRGEPPTISNSPYVHIGGLVRNHPYFWFLVVDSTKTLVTYWLRRGWLICCRRIPIPPQDVVLVGLFPFSTGWRARNLMASPLCSWFGRVPPMEVHTLNTDIMHVHIGCCYFLKTYTRHMCFTYIKIWILLCIIFASLAGMKFACWLPPWITSIVWYWTISEQHPNTYYQQLTTGQCLKNSCVCVCVVPPFMEIPALLNSWRV